MNRRATSWASVLVTALITTFAAAEPFTYQGTLEDNGAPANGEYDLVFRLFNAASGGSQLGSSAVRENTQVTAGLFTVELDFGDNLFLVSPRFLQVEVRPGASGGSFDILTPRTTVNPAPAAQHAATADALTNPIWNQSGSVVSTGFGSTSVLLNRSSTITNNEYFGVHANDTGFVGMFVSGPANSLPYYAYSTDGEISAYTYTDIENSWILNIEDSLVALRVDADGNAFIAGDANADNFNFSAPKTNYHSISGEIFSSASNDGFFASGGSGGAYITNPGSGWLVAPVNLPHGATVTRVRAYVSDTFAGGDMSITLHSQLHGGDFFNLVANVTSAGVNGSNVQLVDNSINLATINNDTSHYHIRVFSTAWPGNGDLRIKSVVIEYTTTQAD